MDGLVSHIRDEHRLKVFEKKMLRVVFGQKEGGSNSALEKLHDKELHNLPDSIRIIDLRLLDGRSVQHA
jgi:hypothetical protein